MSLAILWPVVLVAASLYDFAATRYVVAVDERAAVRAAVWSVATFMVGLISIVSIVKVSYWLIIPECVGSFFGTWIGVAFKKGSGT